MVRLIASGSRDAFAVVLGRRVDRTDAAGCLRVSNLS
jgi:hypothetical protein